MEPLRDERKRETIHNLYYIKHNLQMEQILEKKVTDITPNVSCGEQTLAEEFMEQHYILRRNVLRGLVEFRKIEEDDDAFRPLTEEAMNSMFLRSKHEMGEDVDIKSDVKMYVNSDEIPLFDPINSWLDALPKWDGKDRVVDLWSRIPGLSAEQIYLLSIWIRYLVAEWKGLSSQHGNEVVPVLIGSQDSGKTTFWQNILPECLRDYFLDHFNFQNKFDKDMAMTNCALINLDEMDQYSARQFIVLKQTLSKVKVNGRRIYGHTIDSRKRYASFVATTNNRHPLTDPTGSRRYICLEVPDKQYIDYETEVDYEQLYAQILYELEVKHCRYWFTRDETHQIQNLNLKYEKQLDLKQMIDIYFKQPLTETDENAKEVTTTEIREMLQHDFPEVEDTCFTAEKIGKTMKAMDFPKKKTRTGMFYSVVPKKSA